MEGRIQIPNSLPACHMYAPLTDMSKDFGEKPVAHHALLLYRTGKSFCVARRENQANAEFLARSRGLGPQLFAG